MSELISSIELKKADGAPITFNFQFENGLPIKPIIDVKYMIGLTKETKEIVVMCYFKNKSDYENLNLVIKNISIFELDKNISEVWVHLENSYIVLNINQEYIKLLENQNSYFQFYDYNENILKSLYNKIC
jgi:hypothetical protein